VHVASTTQVLLTPLFADSALKLLLIPIVLYVNWELLAPYVAQGLSNPFAPLLFISYRVPTSPPDNPRYAKGYLDLVFIAYHIVFFSFVRQLITIKVCTPIAKYFGIKKRAKIDRFGEQGYAFLYFSVFGMWGMVRWFYSPASSPDR
jgi:acyl-CoA-dependent ceramide synthase